MKITLREAIEPHPALRNNALVVNLLRDIVCGGIAKTDSLPDDEISPDLAAVLWIYAYIAALGVFNDMAMLATIRAFREPLQNVVNEWVTALSRDDDASLRPCLLALANRTMASLSAAPGWFDLQIGQMIETRPTVFEGISYNLAYPVKIEWLRLQEQQNAKRAL